MSDQQIGVEVNVKAHAEALKEIISYLDQIHQKSNISVTIQTRAAGIMAGTHDEDSGQFGMTPHQAIMKSTQVGLGIARDAMAMRSQGFDPRYNNLPGEGPIGMSQPSGFGFPNIYAGSFNAYGGSAFDPRPQGAPSGYTGAAAVSHAARINRDTEFGGRSYSDDYSGLSSAMDMGFESHSQAVINARRNAAEEIRQTRIDNARLIHQDRDEHAYTGMLGRDYRKQFNQQDKDEEAYRVMQGKYYRDDFNRQDRDENWYTGYLHRLDKEDAKNAAKIEISNEFRHSVAGRSLKGLLYASGAATAQGFNVQAGEITSGTANPVGMAEVGGMAVGGIIGAITGGVISGSNPFGAYIGASVGGQVGQQATNYIMANTMFQYNTQRSMVGYGMQFGNTQQAVSLGLESGNRAQQLAIDSKWDSINKLGGGNEGIIDLPLAAMRWLGATPGSQADVSARELIQRYTNTYAGPNRVDASDVLKGEEALRAGLYDKGVVPSRGDMDAALTKFNTNGSSAGLAQMTARGKFHSAEGMFGGDSSHKVYRDALTPEEFRQRTMEGTRPYDLVANDNLVDVIHHIGAGTYATAAGDDISSMDKAIALAREKELKDRDYSIRKQTYGIEIAKLSGVGAQGVSNIYSGIFGDLQTKYSAVGVPGSELGLSIMAQFRNAQHDNNLNFIQTHDAEANTLGAYHGLNVQQQILHGTYGGFRSEANRYSKNIDREISNIDSDIARGKQGGMSEVEMRNLRNKRLGLIQDQRQLIPDAIHNDLSKFMMGQNASMAENAYRIGSAVNFGSQGDVNTALNEDIRKLTESIKENTKVLNDKNSSDADKAHARIEIANDKSKIEQDVIQARNVKFGREANEYGIRQTELGFGSYKAGMFGTGKDIYDAGTNTGKELDAREKYLKEQLEDKNLTVDQRQNIRKELAAIPQQKMSTRYNSLVQSFDRDDIGGYGYDTMRREGERERLNYLPFSPGSGYKLDLQQLQADQGQLKVIDAREAVLKANNMYGPQQRYDLEKQRQGLYTQDARMLGELSEGMVERLPAFSSGRPSGWHNYDSLSLVQMQLSKVSHPSRYWGALNGQQAAFQDEFPRSFAVPGTMRPYDRNQGLDMAPYYDRMIRALESIERKTQPNTNSSTRPGEQRSGNEAGRNTTTVAYTAPITRNT